VQAVQGVEGVEAVEAVEVEVELVVAEAAGW
jgi:hypothetical protein